MMSFKGKIVTDDANIPLTESGDLDLPPELAELGELLQAESVELARKHPPSPPLQWPSTALSASRRRSLSVAWGAASGIAAACLILASTAAWKQIQTDPAGPAVAAEDSSATENDATMTDSAIAFRDLEVMVGGESAESHNGFLPPVPFATPVPPPLELSRDELLDQIDLLDKAVDGYQSAVERLHEQVQQGVQQIKDMQKMLDEYEAAQ